MRAFDACLSVAAELRAAALDPNAPHSMAERRALATLAAAVEASAATRAGTMLDRSDVEARTAAALAALARADQGEP